MATATYIKGEKESIDYTSAATIAVDTVIVCGAASNVSVGIAGQAMVSGDVGVVYITGAYDFPKVSAGVIKAGESVDWDATLDAVDDNQSTLGTGDVGNFGVALEDAGNGVTTVKVELRPGQGTLG
jgi:predicted RecA/RadA family phage recombinase